MNSKQLRKLLLQSLEQATGGIQVYEAALRCAVNDDLRREWRRCREQSTYHERLLRKICAVVGIDPDHKTPERAIVRSLSDALVDAMGKSLANGDRQASELTACECVLLAETKNHADWQLIDECADEEPDPKVAAILKMACEAIENREHGRLRHAGGWCRELWIHALGMPSVLPPPEESPDYAERRGSAAPRRYWAQRESSPSPLLPVVFATGRCKAGAKSAVEVSTSEP